MPTPTVNGNNNRKGLSEKSGDGLGTFVRMWSTPQASDYRSPNINPGAQGKSKQLPQSSHALPAQAGGSLNPDWVEWLQGFPPGWTEL
jgi:DNA (cytosine-5)-methyltransferase 1